VGAVVLVLSTVLVRQALETAKYTQDIDIAALRSKNRSGQVILPGGRQAVGVACGRRRRRWRHESACLALDNVAEGLLAFGSGSGIHSDGSAIVIAATATQPGEGRNRGL